MKNKKNLLAVAAGLAGCVLVVWFSTSLRGVEKTYEIQPQITVPEYRTDAARAIDAYEHLMDRYMDLTEKNLTRIGTDVRDVGKKLDCINAKLGELSTRMSRIEKALGVEQTELSSAKSTVPEVVEKGGCKKSASD
ncbi:MAG: hypothetical protein ACYSSO_03775 [Planctomycetota bacterium]|jgi:hypothetical protein